jgi:RHS repeat-associated protein
MYNNFGATTPLSFTGDTQDTIAGLFDTPNRELHPNQGRWISPDPAGMSAADPSNPQSWNRYAYVINNPLSNIDPLGLQDCTMDGVDSTCDMVFATVQAGGAAQCPNNNCGARAGSNGQMYSILLEQSDGWGYVGPSGTFANGSEYGLPDLGDVPDYSMGVVKKKQPNWPGGEQVPGTIPRLLYRSILKCDGSVESVVATLASDFSNSPPASLQGAYLRATTSLTPGFGGNSSVALMGSPTTSTQGNQFIQNLTVKSFAGASIDWTVKKINPSQVVTSGTQVVECRF